MSGEIRLGVLALCVDLSHGAAAETARVFRRAAWRSAAGDLHDARAGGRIPRPCGHDLMPQFRTKRRAQHSAAEMFDLVADVERYPEFVPLCERVRVRKRTSGEGTETVVADMT